MTIIVSSDDGPDGAGFHILASLARDRWSNVLESPSVTKTSGLGTSLADGAGNVTCAGAVRTALARSGEADLVLVGINEGPNIWPDGIHSGTLGGLLTALASGIPAIAFSADDVYSSSDGIFDWTTCRLVAGRLLDAFLQHRGQPLQGVSVNISSRISGGKLRVVDVTGRADRDEATFLRQGCITMRDIVLERYSSQPSWLTGHILRDFKDG